MAASAEEVMAKIRLGVSLVLVIFGPLANFMVFLCFVLSKRLQTVANFFIVCLSIPDFLVSSIVQFGDIYVYFTGDENICYWTGAMTNISMSASGIALMMIAINRYYLVTRPTFKYKQVFTPTNSVLMVIANYVFMILVGILPYVPIHFGKLGWNERLHVCVVVDPKKDRNSYFVFVMYALLVFVILFPVTLVCYVKIFMKVRLSALMKQQRAERKRRTQQASLAKKLLLLFFTFVAFWTPVVFMFLTDYYGEYPHPAYDFGMILAYVRAATNPIFYSWASTDFRKAYKQIFKCLRGAKVDFSEKTVRITSVAPTKGTSLAPASTAADVPHANMHHDEIDL